MLLGGFQRHYKNKKSVPNVLDEPGSIGAEKNITCFASQPVIGFPLLTVLHIFANNLKSFFVTILFFRLTRLCQYFGFFVLRKFIVFDFTIFLTFHYFLLQRATFSPFYLRSCDFFFNYICVLFFFFFLAFSVFLLLLPSHLSILSSHSPACSPVFPSSVTFYVPPSDITLSGLHQLPLLSLSLSLSVLRRSPLCGLPLC